MSFALGWIGGLVVGLGLGWFLGREVLHRQCVDYAREHPEIFESAGVLIKKEDHRCDPPDSVWTPGGTCLVGYGRNITPGDQWVCGCTKVWESKARHWEEVS